MSKLIKTLWSCVGNILEEIAEAVEDENYSYAIKKTVVLLTIVLSIIGFFALLVALLYTGRKIIIAVASPILIVALLIASYRANCPGGTHGGAFNSDDEVDEVMAEQEAAENYDDMRNLVYNAIVSVAENAPIHRPRDEFTIETNREKPYRMDGDMAIYQFEVDYNGVLERSMFGSLLQEIQRYINKYGRRYPLLMWYGHPPVVFDLKDAGGFMILEIVLYSDRYKDKIDARKRARIARQQKAGDTYDRDF